MSRKKRTLPLTVEKLLESIDVGALKHVPIDPSKPGGNKQPRLRSLLARSRELLMIDAASESGLPDGFPTNTPGNGSPGGGKGGGTTMLIKDPKVKDDPGDRVPASSTELAALARAPRADPLRGIAREVETQLRAIDTALLRIGSACDRWDRLRSTAELLNPAQCWVASVMHQLPFDEKWEPHVRTTFVGVLDDPWKEERPVCRMVYDFTRDHGRLPSSEEMTQYLERVVVRVQTGAFTTGKA